MLRPDTGDHLRAIIQRPGQWWQRDYLIAIFRQAERPVFHDGGQKVHPGRADETGDKLVGRIVIQVQRRAGLFDQPIAQHDDFIGQSHRLDLIMGDVDDGGLQFLVQAGDFNPHLHPQFGIQI